MLTQKRKTNLLTRREGHREQKLPHARVNLTVERAERLSKRIASKRGQLSVALHEKIPSVRETETFPCNGRNYFREAKSAGTA